MKKLFVVLFILIQASIAYGQMPQATPPGFPVVGMLEQHMNDGLGNFFQVDRVWNDQGDIVRYYFNQSNVKNEPDEGYITVWFLEEYTPQGRDMMIKAYDSQGMNTAHLKDMKYQYYQITLAYVDAFGNAYESEFDYEFSILPLGEVCDSRQKILSYIQTTGKFQKLNTPRDMHYIMLGNELKKRYDLK